MKLHNFIVNVFATNDLDGAATAVLAHVYAKERNGAVTVRYLSPEETDKELGGLIKCVMDAQARGDAMAKHIELWVNDMPLSDEVVRDVLWFRREDADDEHKRLSVILDGPYQLPCSPCTDFNTVTTAIIMFLSQVYAATHYGVKNDVAILYDLLEHDDFVDVVASMLIQHPWHFCLTDDSTLNMFISNYKRRHGIPVEEE